MLPWREKLSIPKTGQSRAETFHSYFASSLQRDPYRVVVSEMMLQQTQVERVLPKFEAWLAKWPTTAALANASLAEVLIFWQGLGYNRRAKFLWQLAQQIEARGGVWPTTEEELLELPGIGRYTARAVMSFAMGEQVGVVDTNIKRVLGRAFGEVKDYFQLADEVVPAGQADPWNQALMDLGAMVCTARAPKCPECPLQQSCQAYLTGSINILPVKKISKKPLVRFEDSDRFFRGRIMDLLREKSYQLEELAEKMETEFGLIDAQRFQKLVNGLVAEELISRKENKITLG